MTKYLYLLHILLLWDFHKVDASVVLLLLANIQPSFLL